MSWRCGYCCSRQAARPCRPISGCRACEANQTAPKFTGARARTRTCTCTPHPADLAPSGATGPVASRAQRRRRVVVADRGEGAGIAPPAAAQATASTPSLPASYVDNQQCLGCHQDQGRRNGSSRTTRRQWPRPPSRRCAATSTTPRSSIRASPPASSSAATSSSCAPTGPTASWPTSR